MRVLTMGGASGGSVARSAPTALPREALTTPRPARVSPRSPLYRFTPRVHLDAPLWVQAVEETLRQTSQALDVTRDALVTGKDTLQAIAGGPATGS